MDARLGQWEKVTCGYALQSKVVYNVDYVHGAMWIDALSWVLGLQCNVWERK
jgi:hypothetical protein